MPLKNKVEMHQPPVSPKNMGLEGEYDPNGLAKRVAAAFDKNPDVMKQLQLVYIH
jgi:hypothetical protein